MYVYVALEYECLLRSPIAQQRSTHGGSGHSQAQNDSMAGLAS